MSKQKQRQKTSETEMVVDTPHSEPKQAVENEEVFAKTSEEPASEETNKLEKPVIEPAVVETAPEKSSRGGKALAILAILLSVAVCATGYYWGEHRFKAVEQQLKKVADQTDVGQTHQEWPTFEQEKAQINLLQSDAQALQSKVVQLEGQQEAYLQQIEELKAQVQKLGSVVSVEPTVWILSDADFLLNNALRKLVLENDIDAAKMLISEADSTLAQVNTPEIASLRAAINADLAQLNSLNEVDQNSLMQRLAHLANLVDEMPLLESEHEQKTQTEGEVSASVEDWQDNLEKSANSFLNHFIRIKDKTAATDKGFIAPNQEIYLRENIRLRLQIAIMAVPRQQNELYQQSLEAISTWLRSYFDVENHKVKQFLADLDELMDQSVYVDAPNRLQSIELMAKMLNKPTKKLDKIQLESQKSLEQLKVEDEASSQQTTPNSNQAQ